MGFGTLLFGCALLFNVIYYQITDVIAAVIILYALYKLNKFNTPLRVSYICAYPFAAFTLFELVLGAWRLFDPMMDQSTYSGYLATARAALLLAVMLPLMLGIAALAREVDAKDLRLRAMGACAVACVSTLTTAVASLPFTVAAFGDKAQVWLYVCTMVLQLIFALVAVLTVWRAYATICMPEDNAKKKKMN